MQATPHAPLVTVVTPTYNRADLIDATIESVLSQQYPAIEYIVLDDGSTDRTASVLARYADRIRVVRHANMGEHRTVNRGWALARGDIIVTLNDDDVLLPGAIREAVGALEADRGLLVVYPDYALIDHAGRLVGHVTAGEFDYAEAVRHVSCLPGPGAFMRRDAVRLAGGGRNAQFTYVGDCEFWLRVGMAGPMARIPRTLAAHRVHRGSLSIQFSEAMMDDLLALVDHLFDALDLPARLRPFKREATSNVLATIAHALHHRSYFSALPYFCRSLAVHPRAWVRRPLPVILGRMARMAVPNPILAPPLAYWHRKRAEQLMRVHV